MVQTERERERASALVWTELTVATSEQTFSGHELFDLFIWRSDCSDANNKQFLRNAINFLL